MNSQQRSIWLLLGLAAATGAGLSLAPDAAMAQILDPPTPVETRPVRPKPPPEPADPSLSPDDQTPPDTGFAPEVTPATVAPAGAEDGVEPQDTEQLESEAQETVPGVTPEDQGDLDEFGAARARARVVPPQDGELPTVLEAPGPSTEGILDLNQPSALPNEEEATLIDLRNARDRGGYGGIAAGFDPLLLEAQETNPVFSDIGGSRFDPDPFVPLGTRLGSFTLFTALQVDGDYNSNLFASPLALGDYALELWPSARLASNWSSHALEIRASGDLSFHDRFSSEDDRAYLVQALSRLDITRFSNIQSFLSHEFAQESRSAINATSFGTRPNIIVDRASLAGNQRFNRLTVQVRGTVIDTSYGDDVVAGQVESNADRDFLLTEEAVRPQWEFNPNLYLFSDVALNQRDYPTAAFTDGLNRTSQGQRYRLGVSFGSTGEYLRGSVSIGYGTQVYDNPQLIPINAFLFDADLTWRITPLTSLLFTAVTDVAETTTNDAGGVLERTYALEGRHNFSTRLVGSLGATYYNRNFVGGSLTEQQSTEAAGLEYYLSRAYVLFSRYQHTNFYTTSENGNYSVEEAQVGVRIRR